MISRQNIVQHFLVKYGHTLVRTQIIKRTDYKQHVRWLNITELEVYVTKKYFVNFKISASMIASQLRHHTAYEV